MRKTAGTLVALAMAAGFAAWSAQVTAQDAQATYRDIEQTLGIVPGFFKLFPETAIAGAWSEFKSLQLNPKTKLDAKTKELIGLAVSAQIPCTYCVHFHSTVLRGVGASEEEMREAVAMAAVVRHWSTVLNGMQVDMAEFKRELDTVMRIAGERAKQGKGQ